MARSKRRTHGEGTVYQKRPGYWSAQIRHQGERITASGDTADAARRSLAAKLTALDEKSQRATADWTVESFLTRWISDLRAAESLKPSTYRRYEGITRVYLIPVLGERPLAELSKQDVAGLIQSARTGIGSGRRVHPPSETTLHHVHAVLRSALESAVAQGFVDRNVARLVKGPPMRHRPKIVLDGRQAVALINAAKGEALGAAVILGMATGMREGEILGLRRGDVDLEAGTLSVASNCQIGYSGERELGEPKTEAGKRRISLPAFAVAALREHLRGQDPPSLLLFPTRAGRLMPAPDFLRRHFHPILDKAGLPRMPFHDLRHSAATLLKEMDVDVVTISHILGHASPATTLKFYGHVTPTLARRAADRMDRLLTIAGDDQPGSSPLSEGNGSQMAAN